MRYLEPCCYHKQIGNLIELCETNVKNQCVQFFSNSDWSASDLLTTFSSYAQDGTLCVAMIHLDVTLIETIRKILARTYIDNKDKSVKHPFIRKMILVTQPGSDGCTIRQREEVHYQLGKYIDGGRLTVCEDNIGFRCFLAGNDKHRLVVQGSINQQMCHAMQMFTLTTTEREYKETLEMFEMKGRMKNIFRNSHGKTL